MIWLMTSVLVIIICIAVLQFYLLRKQQKSVEGFDMLLTKFIESNQDFYESQKNIHKKDKEIFDSIIKQTAELSSMRKHNNLIQIGLKNMTDAIKLLKESQKDIKLVSDELKSNSNLASSLSIISNNIKLLDKVISNMNHKK